MKILKIFVLCFLAITTNCHAQQKASKSYNWQVKPFDAGSIPVTGKLPPEFTGHALYRLLAAYQRPIISKGTYETTAAFEKRKRARRNKPLFGQIYITSDVTIMLRPDTSYNADTSTLTLELQGYPSNVEEAIEFSMAGVVAEGVRMTNKYSFSFVQKTVLPIEGSFVSTTMKVAPDKAKRLTENLSVALSGKLQEPLFTSGFCNLEVSSITFYDFTSGYIYARITP
ncbi:hypothetical protein B1R32_11581 [Abditibacterium utsteinense]|uniref:Uncharacterized protein n=1 Tax=Abditibacterium utsteinense TaxID=1960156 RepID=A0A2S8SQU9_9BACT|nr:hypothetical protein [Abditibacterium utsteinense]PQV63173.1 hypothetical protein B1R32_11581 [Abditibacterium utsteinense]